MLRDTPVTAAVKTSQTAAIKEKHYKTYYIILKIILIILFLRCFFFFLAVRRAPERGYPRFNSGDESDST